MMGKPNFFIVGKPKSGTTSLHQMLGEHPEIFMSTSKEPHHFHEEHMAAGEARKRGFRGRPYQRRDKYLGLFAKSGSCRVVGESSTGYLYSKTAARNIAKLCPDAKILMCFREPVDFLYSFHSQLIRSANEAEADFPKALALEESRRCGRNVPSTATYPANLFYSEHIMYRDQAARFFDNFPSRQIKVLIYEDFKMDNLACFRDLLRFLDVDSTFEPTAQVVNRTKGLRAPRLSRWLYYIGEKSPYAVARWMPAPVLDPLRQCARKLLQHNRPLPELDPELVRQLRSRFQPEVIKFSEFLGIDLYQKWGYDTEN